VQNVCAIGGSGRVEGQLCHNLSGQLRAVYQVVEHFGVHYGQIVFITKLVRADDLGFYRELDKTGRLPRTSSELSGLPTDIAISSIAKRTRTIRTPRFLRTDAPHPFESPIRFAPLPVQIQ
jgi:hypothetical protein